MLEPTRFSLIRADGFGTRLGVEFEKGLGNGATAAAGLTYDKVGTSVGGGKTDSSGFQPMIRFASAI